jgi:ribosome-binding protein aMBF1 (putative translation factor)
LQHQIGSIGTKMSVVDIAATDDVERRKRRLHPGEMPEGPTGRQIRAARSLLGWSIATLAQAAGVAARTITRAEAAEDLPDMRTSTLRRIRQALEGEGIEFTQNANGTGVRLRRRP